MMTEWWNIWLCVSIYQKAYTYNNLVEKRSANFLIDILVFSEIGNDRYKPMQLSTLYIKNNFLNEAYKHFLSDSFSFKKGILPMA